MNQIETAASSSNSVFRRYTAVTLVSSPANLGLFYLFLTASYLSAPAATLTAAAVVSPLTLVAYRRFVWRLDSASSRDESVRYLVMTLIGIATAALTAQALTTQNATPTTFLLGNLGTYTVIWAARFLFLDRILFRQRRCAGASDSL